MSEEEERKLQYLVPKEKEEEEEGPYLQCNVCSGFHTHKQAKNVGHETDLGFWFICKGCNTTLLLSNDELEAGKAEKAS